MKQTSRELLILSFGNDEQKIKEYIIDAEIDVVMIGDDLIPADLFHHDVHKYMGEQETDTNSQTQIT